MTPEELARDETATELARLVMAAHGVGTAALEARVSLERLGFAWRAVGNPDVDRIERAAAKRERKRAAAERSGRAL